MRGAGKFDKRVSILEKNEDADQLNEYGHFPNVWAVKFQRWANFETAGGREFQQQDQVQAEVTHRIILRSDSGTRTITPKHRVQFKNRIFELTKAVDVNEGLMEVALDCKELVT